MRRAAESRGVCQNTLALPIAETDRQVVDIVADEVLSPRMIDELLAAVSTVADEGVRLRDERDRLRAESTGSRVWRRNCAPRARPRPTSRGCARR